MDEVSLIIHRARRGNCKSINLSNRAMLKFPQSLFKIITLESLNISKNQITSIPDSISELENLQFLDISENDIITLPQSIQSLQNLKQINLTGNPISLGIIYKSQLKSILYSLFLQHKPEDIIEISNKTSLTNKTEDDTFGIKTSLQGVTKAEYSQLKLGLIYYNDNIIAVYEGIWRGINVSIKLIVNPNITQEMIKRFEHEVMMLNYLRHPSTTLLMAASLNSPYIFMITELVQNQTLFDHLHNSQEVIPLKRRIKFIEQISQAFMFYHNSGVVYMNLNSKNILIDCDYNIKICGFSFARFKNELNKETEDFAYDDRLRYGYKGKIYEKNMYTAPEMYKKQMIDEKIDVFAFGTLVWEILSREIPGCDMDPEDIKEHILTGNLKSGPIFPPRKYQELIYMCRQLNPANRPDFQSIYGYLTHY